MQAGLMSGYALATPIHRYISLYDVLRTRRAHDPFQYSAVMAQALLWVGEIWKGPGPSLWELLQPWPLQSQHCVPGGQAQGQDLGQSYTSRQSITSQQGKKMQYMTYWPSVTICHEQKAILTTRQSLMCTHSANSYQAPTIAIDTVSTCGWH